MLISRRIGFNESPGKRKLDKLNARVFKKKNAGKMYIAITSVEFIKYSRAWMGMLFRSMECEWKEKKERKARRLFFLVAHARHYYRRNERCTNLRRCTLTDIRESNHRG